MEKKGFRQNTDQRDAITRRTGRASLGETQSNYLQYNADAVEAVRTGDYSKAQASYSLLVAEAALAQDVDMQIEAMLRLAGVTHKSGDDESAKGILVDALKLKEQSGSQFDVESFLQENQ